MTNPELGAVAVSRAGHDKGIAFVILGKVEEEYVLLCDGRTRKLASPKKKKLRHVHIESVKAEEIAQKLISGQPLTDADMRKALTRLGYNLDRQ